MENNMDNFASYSTTASGDPNSENKIINLQFRWWIDACLLYTNQIENSDIPIKEDIVLVIHHCYQSLLHLFGQNYDSGDGYTPPLINEEKGGYLDKYIPEKLGYYLKNDKPEIYNRLKNYSDTFNNVCKHTDISKRYKLSALTKTDALIVLECTRQVWIWFGQKQFNLIPNEHMQYFSNSFYKL